MGSKAKLGGGIIGLIFLAVGVLKMVQGGHWVVWIILGLLFGGLPAIGKLLGKRGEG